MASTRTLLTFALYSTTLACGGGGGFPDAKVIDAPPPGGRFSLAWTVTDAQGNAATCDKIGGASVSIAYHDPKVSGGGAEAFTCSTGMGTSQMIPPGSYDMTVTLVDTTGVTLVAVPVEHNVVITGGQTTALTSATFAVEATGNLKLHIASLQAGGNCAAKALGGAGIIATTITLQNGSDGSCAVGSDGGPVTFAVGSGSNQPAGSYTVDCATPVVGPCIETDQELDALAIPSGSYQIHVNAYEDLTGSGSGSGSGACWTNNDSLVVPSTGRDLNDTLNLGATHGSGC